MTECDVCKIMANKGAFHVVYEDGECLAVLHEAPASPGHTLVFPKSHCPIFEEVPDNILGHLFAVANKLSSAIFDSQEFQGTNVIVNNGISAGQELPHFMINIIPRRDGDNLNFEWTPFKRSDQELNVTQNILKTALQPKKPVEQPKPETQKMASPKTDLMAQRLRRIP
jgi:histidine triad (HIT) family protein